MKKMPAKILVIRFSSIGDIVLTSPVVRCLKMQLGAEVHFLTKKKFAEIAYSNPHIDKVIAFESDLSSILEELKKEQYDCIVDLHHNLRSIRVSLALGIKAYRFAKLNFRKWLLVRFKINRMPAMHIVDRYMESLIPLGIVNDGQGLDFFIPSEEEVNTADFSLDLTHGYHAVVCGATYYTKSIPEEKIIALGQKSRLPFLLLGSKADWEKAERIRNVLGEKVFNACGAYSLHQSASLIKQSASVLTPDTGLMHIAAALRKPIVSLWGNTVPEFGMYPYLAKDSSIALSVVMEIKNLPCRPCSKLGHAQCPQKHFKCMQMQDENAILKALEREN